MSIAILFGVFLLLSVLTVPVGVSIALAVIASLWHSDLISLSYFVRAMTNSANSFLLTSVPFFCFGGVIMAKAGISAGLFDVAKVWVGRVRGGILMVTVLACMAFGAISGSVYATVVAIGLIALPELYKAGMSKGAAAALIATAGCCGTMIPPSMSLIVFGSINDLSVSDLFAAAILPGLLVSGCFLTYSYIYGKKHNIYSETGYTMKEKFGAIWKNRFALIMPIIILGGIYSGMFTPTEAAVVAVVYGLFYGFLKKEGKIPASEIPGMLKSSCMTTATIMFILAASTGFGRIIALEEIPTKLATFFISTIDSQVVILIVLNLLIIFLGTFLDGAAINVILSPILLNIAVLYGIDPLHFGVMFSINACVGLLTPPLGANLFVAAQISDTPFDEIVKHIWPWIAAMLIGLILVAAFPGLSTWLPSLI